LQSGLKRSAENRPKEPTDVLGGIGQTAPTSARHEETCGPL